MDIKNEILELILQEDFLVVPEVGAFIAEFEPPFQLDNGEIIPPQKRITYNSLIVSDSDDKLISKIFQQKNYPIADIISKLNQFKKEFKSQLFLIGQYNWDGVGKFYFNGDSEIDWEPIIGRIPIQTHIDNYEIEYSEEIEIVAKKQNNYWLYIVPILLLGMGLLFMIFQSKFTKPSLELNEAPMDSVLKLEITDSSSLAYPISKDSVEEKAETKISVNEKPKPTSDFIILSVGLFEDRDNVEKLATKLAENGIPIRMRVEVRKENGVDKNFYRIYTVANSSAQAKEFEEKIYLISGIKAIIKQK